MKAGDGDRRCFMFTLGAVFASSLDEAELFACRTGMTGPRTTEMYAELIHDMISAETREVTRP